MIHDDGGTAAVTTLVMLPLLLVVLAGALEFGALRAVAYRVAAAADLATLVAVNDQDDYFARNIEATASALAASASEIAASADIASFPTAPAIDPRTGARYDRPTVRLIASVPVKTPGLAVLLWPAVTTITIRAASSPR